MPSTSTGLWDALFNLTVSLTASLLERKKPFCNLWDTVMTSLRFWWPYSTTLDQIGV